MKILFRKTALKQLKKIDKSQAKRIYEKIQELNNYPNVSNIKKLTNYNPSYRLRVGDYRVLFDIEDEKLIIIFFIRHRSEAYES